MYQTIEFPDVDELAVNLVYDKVGAGMSVEVASQLPSPVPDRFIQCYSLPGRELSPRTLTCQVVIRVYDTTDQVVRCSKTARLIGSTLRAAPNILGAHNEWVSEPCERQGPYPIQDPEVPNRVCYQANVTWTIQSQVVNHEGG